MINKPLGAMHRAKWMLQAAGWNPKNFPLAHPKGWLGSVSIESINRKWSRGPAVLGRTAPHFPLCLALFHQRNKNGTWDIITLAELAAEKFLCLLKCAQSEISALPLALPPLTRGRFLIFKCVFIIKCLFSGRFGSCLVQIPK